MSLQVHFDHAQARVGDDRISLFASGLEFSAGTGGYVEPITGTSMLKPYQFEPSWYTSSSGNYAKMGLTDFGLSTTSWEVRADQHWAGPWLCLKDSASNVRATSTASYSKNTGWFLSWFSYGSGDRFVQLKCGWSNTSSDTDGVAVYVWSDGDVTVYKDGERVGSGKIGAPSNTSQAGSVVSVALIPFRHRELLVAGNLNGFSVVFDDIAEDAVSPTITGATKFWWEIASGATQVQVSRIKYPTSGYVDSQKLSWIEAPATGETAGTFNNTPWPGGSRSYRVFGHGGYVGTQDGVLSIRNWDGTSFTPDGTRTESLLRVTMSTDDQYHTPSVYGGITSYLGTIVNTDATEQVNVTDYVDEGLTLSVPDTAEGASASFTIRDPDNCGVVGVKDQVSRPVLLRAGTMPFFDGVAEAPSYQQTANSLADVLAFTVNDRWHFLRTQTFKEPVPLDGTNLEACLKFLARRGGFESAHTSVSTTSFSLPFTPSRDGEFSIMIEPGDNPADWVARLIDDYASDWVYGIRPNPATGAAQFFALSPADLGTSEERTIYPTKAQAEDVGIGEADAPYFLYWDFSKTLLQPLANDVRVTGVNPRTGRAISAQKVDASSKNPATAPSSRGDNWLGHSLAYGLVDPALTDQATVNWATERIFDKFSQVQEVVQWRSDFLAYDSGVPLWRGANVRLYGKGTYRILSFDGSFVNEQGGGGVREFYYTGLKVADEPV